MSVRLGTYNLGSASAQRLGVDLHELTSVGSSDAVDILGWNEGGDRAPLLQDIAAESGYQLHQGDDDGEAKTGLLVGPRFRIVATGWWHCTPRTFVGPSGAGPASIAAKSIAWAELEDIESGLHLVAGSTHLVPSVQRPPFPGRTKRRRLFRTHIARAVEWVEEMAPRGPVFLLGDLNATDDYPDLAPLLQILDAGATGPTFGRRRIDYVLVAESFDVTCVRTVLAGFSSDHRPVVADSTITEAS